LPIVFGLIILALEGLCATLGGIIGASLRRSDDRSHQTPRPALLATRPASFLLMAPTLGLLVWISAAEFNALGGAHRLLGLSDLATGFANQAFGLWLLGILVALAFVFVSAWPAAAPRGIGATREA
jgi:hypothetical protein